MALPKVYDWTRIRSAMRQLHEEFPDLLEELTVRPTMPRLALDAAVR